jgi:hypothetical protein
MQSITATWLICFFWAWNSRAIHGFTTIQNGGGGGGSIVGSPKLDPTQLVHRATPLKLKRDSLDEMKDQNFLALARLSSRYSVTLEVLWEKRDQLEAARNELAASESKPGTSNDDKERLQEEQKQIKLQIEAYRTVIASLQPVFGGATKRQLQMFQIWQPVIFAGILLLGFSIPQLLFFLAKV